MPHRPTRRGVLAGAGALVLAAGASRAALAQAVPDRKLAFIILRGGMDGLAAVPPVGDSAYHGLRGALALSPDEALPLESGFALHPSLARLHAMYRDGDAAMLHAAASPYRERSHFDAQDVLESGASAVFAAEDGWLNRALAAAGVAREAVAIGPAVPLVLRGGAPAASWAPNILPSADQDTLHRLMDLYADDALLGPALASAVEIDMVAGDIDMGAGATRPGPRSYEPLMRAAGRLMAAEGGADLAVVSLDGWDTHANQGAATGSLALRLGALDAALAGLREELGAAWGRTVVLVATEFGRTVAVNGTRGTDHGTGSAAFILGGAVRGGRMLGDWPGLDRLYEGRDLYPANDLRALFKGVLAEHWGLDRSALDTRVFPQSAGVTAMNGVVI